MRFAAILVFSPALFAFQAMTGSLSGGVSDPSGAMVPQAMVVAANEDGHREMAYTNDEGAFSFPRLPAGRYAVEVRRTGFAPFVKQGVEVAASSDVRLDVPIQVGAAIQIVDVVAPRPAAVNAAAPRRSPQRLHVGGNLQASRLVKMVKPVYPEAARQLGIEGSVLLDGVIATDGSVLALQPASVTANSQLVQAATDAVRQWRYMPALLNGVPVEIQTTITINFRLE